MISKTLKETRLLLLVGLIDLLVTLIVFNLAGFDASVEANNIFSKLLAKSPCLFALVKISSLLVFLSIIEFIRQKDWVEERKIKRYLKVAIAMYIILWLFLTAKANILPLL